MNPVDPNPIIMDKTYSGESIIDLEQDIEWALCDAQSEDIILQDEYGIPNGEFHVTIRWIPYEKINIRVV